jgi:hypothetical protein
LHLQSKVLRALQAVDIGVPSVQNMEDYGLVHSRNWGDMRSFLEGVHASGHDFVAFWCWRLGLIIKGDAQSVRWKKLATATIYDLFQRLK